MAKIEKLEEQLYAKKEDVVTRRTRRRFFFPALARILPSFWPHRAERGGPPRHPIRLPGAKNILLIGLVLLAIVGGGTLLALRYLGGRGTEAELKILSPESVESGEIISVPFVIKNTSRSVLKDVELAVIFPQGTLLRENQTEEAAPPRFARAIDDIAPGQEHVTTVAIRLFGLEGEEKTISAAVSYRPDPLGARFHTGKEQNILIRTVPLSVAWEFPETTPVNQEFTVVVRYSSNAQTPYENVLLRLHIPDQFKLRAADPVPDRDEATWTIGRLEPGTSEAITLKGAIEGTPGESYAFRGELGFFDERSGEWIAYASEIGNLTPAVQPITISAALYDSRTAIVKPGQKLDFSLRYKNNTKATLKNIALRAFLEERPLLDMPTLSIENKGVFDLESRSIIWGPGSVEGLRVVRPGANGELTFSVRTKAIPPVADERDFKGVVRLHAELLQAEGPETVTGGQILAEDLAEFKIETVMQFSARALYADAPIPNSGPIPPRVGERTTYNILMDVRNFTNDAVGALARTILPTHVKWETAMAPPGTTLEFNEKSREAVWRIGKVPAGTGILKPSLLAAFQVSVFPSEFDVGDTLGLTNSIEFSAEDAFTKGKFLLREGALTTQTKGDPTIKQGQGRVAPADTPQ
ncbi:MAG: hypothetical protein AAB539_01180 [Patescibacteria group bacterium]